MIGVFQDNVLGGCQFQSNNKKIVKKNMQQIKVLLKFKKYLGKKDQMHGMIQMKKN